MFKTINLQIQIGFDWRATKRAHDGLENAGIFTIC
jgi:hypothetical protein